jgi:hypothetical protein
MGSDGQRIDQTSELGACVGISDEPVRQIEMESMNRLYDAFNQGIASGRNVQRVKVHPVIEFVQVNVSIDVLMDMLDQLFPGSGRHA